MVATKEEEEEEEEEGKKEGVWWKFCMEIKCGNKSRNKHDISTKGGGGGG